MDGDLAGRGKLQCAATSASARSPAKYGSIQVVGAAATAAGSYLERGCDTKIACRQLANASASTATDPSSRNTGIDARALGLAERSIGTIVRHTVRGTAMTSNCTAACGCTAAIILTRIGSSERAWRAA
jgi:hypothetical protein